MRELQYQVWWFWHRFNPRVLWRRATTYEVPVRVRYGAHISHQTIMRRRRWDRPPARLTASTKVRCLDSEWQEIEGTTYVDYGKARRINSISVYFDLPCEQGLLDDPYVWPTTSADPVG